MNLVDPEEEEEEKKTEETPNADPDLEVKQPETNGAVKVNGAVPPSPSIPDETAAPATPQKKQAQPIKLTPEELLSKNSGLLVFKVHDVQLAKDDCYLQVMMDDFLFPAFSSSKIRSKRQKLEEIGDAMVRELEFSRVTLRLIQHNRSDGKVEKDDLVAELKGNTLSILKQCLYKPTALTLKHRDGATSKITVTLRYIPILMQLDERESITNMGTLRVDVLDGKDLPAADRNGKSDPYVVFELNGDKVFKTEIQKKTLTPAWNEFFEVSVPSKVAAKFKCKVMDWDLAGDDDFLGGAEIDLTKVQPFQKSVTEIPLDGKSGSIRLGFVFKPDYVTRARHTTSTFNGTFAVPGKIVTNVAGAPIKGITKVGGGVVKGASFLGRGITGRRKDSELPDESPAFEDTKKYSDIPETAVQDSKDTSTDGGSPTRLKTPNRDSRDSFSLNPFGSHRSQKSISGASIVPETGTANITLVTASGYPSGAKLQVYLEVVGKKRKEIFKSRAQKSTGGDVNWNNDEHVSYPATPDQQYIVTVFNDAMFGHGDKLGEGMLVVNDSGKGGETVVPCGPGKITFKTSFKAADEQISGSSPRPASRKSLFKGRNHSPP